MSLDVEWTPEMVRRFWDAKVEQRPEIYFSAMHAPALAGWIARRARPRRGAPIVDVGCGTGHLLVELAHRGFEVFGVESSAESLRTAAANVGAMRVAEGSVTSIPLQTASVGCVTLVETIEHVLDDELAPMMAEIRRVLEPDAPLVITTPNAEDLSAVKVTCPACGARFHPMQHVRSWSATSLRAFLQDHGFGDVTVFETRLPPGRGVASLARQMLYRMRRDRVHLLAIARPLDAGAPTEVV